MARFDDPDDFPGVREAEAGRRPAYDPLFGDWGEHAPPKPVADGDSLFGYTPVASDNGAAYNFYGYGSEQAFPDRYQPQYQEQMTELQRRLREGTITIPGTERKWIVTVRELAETLLLAVLIFLAVRASFQNFRVEGASMNPSLQNGEYLIVNKLSYAEIDMSMFNFLPFFDAGDEPVHHLWGGPERGDVIVFSAPTSPSRDFIKRIIGVPGDTIHIDEENSIVEVNGNALTEAYTTGLTRCGSTCDIVVPESGTVEANDTCASDNCYFVMGDNRQNSSDSRQGWMVPEENIVGKTFITYWEEGGPNIGLAPNHAASFAEEDDTGAPQ